MQSSCISPPELYPPIPVVGSKGAAEVTSKARRIDGKWGLSRVEVVFENGERHALELDDKAAGGLEDAPSKVVEALRPGDVFFTIGAGDIDQVGPQVLEALRKGPWTASS